MPVTYRLFLCRQGEPSPFYQLPSNQMLGSYTVGDVYVHMGQQTRVAKVAHSTLTAPPDNIEHQTFIVLAPMTADDNPVPWPW